MSSSRLFSLLAGFVVFVVGSLGSLLAQAEQDMLERPALISKRTVSSMMLAVTRAGTRLVAVGERGGVLYSDDNGVAWKQAKVPVSVSLTNVFFITAQKGWAVGHSGVVLTTRDGGETWVKQLDGKQAAILVQDAEKRKAGSDVAIASQQHMADAQRLVADGPDKPFLDVYFSNENTGYIVGAYGLIFRTNDGGKSWIPWQDHIDNPKGKHLNCIRASNAALYIAGEQGGLFRSTDNGEHFVEVRTPYSGSYFGVEIDPDGGLDVYGLRGNVFWSGDAGKNWQKVAVDTPSLLAADTRLTDGSLLIVSNNGDVLRSTDSGRSFSSLNVGQRSPFTGVTEAADGSLILSGTRGITRLRSISTQVKTK